MKQFRIMVMRAAEAVIEANDLRHAQEIARNSLRACDRLLAIEEVIEEDEAPPEDVA